MKNMRCKNYNKHIEDDYDYCHIYGVNFQCEICEFNRKKRNVYERIKELERKSDKLDEKIEKMNKRLINLEKVYLMMYDEFDKKLEMLRENNNLFAEEIKKIGGFEEDEDDLSHIKEICNAFERVYRKEDENDDKKYHLQIKLYKNETPTSYTFVKGFDSHLLNKDVAGSLYDMISTLENDAYNVINKDIEEFVEEYDVIEEVKE